MSVTIRTDDPRELLALVPYQLGFQPRESVVLLSIRAPRSRIGLVARADLADVAKPSRGAQLSRNLIANLAADGARRALVVLYTAEDLQRGDVFGRPTAGVRCVRNLRAAADGVLEDLDFWVVAPGGYYALGCSDRECCPLGGRALRDLQATRIGAQMVLDGVQVVESREDLVRIRPAAPAARKSARRARVRWDARGRGASTGTQMYRWRRDGLSLWRAELARALRQPSGDTASGPPASTVVGKLQAALDDVLVRDAVLLTFVGADRVADRVAAGDTGPDVGRALGAMLDPARGTPPERARCAAVRSLLEELVSYAPRGRHGPALTLLAVLSWWEGDGVRARVLVERALVADPAYRLAALIDEALMIGMPPGWVRGAAAGALE